VSQLRKYSLYMLAVCMCWTVFFGCQSKPEMTDPKAALEREAEEYWNKRFIARDYKATYEMELERDSIPYEKYQKMVFNAGQIDYESVKVKSVEMQDDRARVELAVRVNIPPVPKAMDLTMSDEWVLKSNQWKHVLPEKDGTKPPDQR